MEQNTSSSSNSSSFGSGRTLTDREAETYDRQIRLWGVEGQRRLLASRILVSGIDACGAEATKNIVLAGTRVTLHDTRLVEGSDLGAQYFLSASDIGNNVSVASEALFHWDDREPFGDTSRLLIEIIR